MNSSASILSGLLTGYDTIYITHHEVAVDLYETAIIAAITQHNKPGDLLVLDFGHDLNLLAIVSDVNEFLQIF